MKIAIYSRKSKLTEQGDSIQNQILMCKEYANNHFKECEFLIYEDEGFSGKNTDRPMFQQLIRDITNKKINVLMCYRLDRISRSVADFSDTLELLARNEIAFVSLSEQFDTSTPMGRAMIYIASVFAQLERDTIAERIKDNMLHLAKSGRWTGGLTPTGFEAKLISNIDNSGNNKNMTILSPIETETDIIIDIYDKYLELQSLNAVEVFLVQNSYKTKKDNYFTVATIRDILRNPVYAVADEKLYSFFLSKNSELCNPKEDFNGEYGVIPYNRVNKKKNERNKHNDWIIAIGRHKGIIPSEKYIAVQNLLEANSKVLPRAGTGDYGLFANLIKCSKCGSTMRIKKGRINSDGTQEFYYICSLKEMSHKQNCDVRNLIGLSTDEIIIEYLENLSKDKSLFENELTQNKINFSEEKKDKTIILNKLNSELLDKNTQIKNLVTQLTQNQNSKASKYIVTQIEELDKSVEELVSKISQLEIEINETEQKELNISALKDALASLSQLSFISNILLKRNLIRIILSLLEWDGEVLTLNFNCGIGVQTLRTFSSDCKSGSPWC